MSRARPARLPVLGLLVAGPARRRIDRQPQGHRLLLAARRRAARRRHRADADPLPLGPAGRAAGRRRLDQPRHRLPLRRVRRGRGRGAGRPGRHLDHAERAVVLGVPRLRRRRARARPHRRRRVAGRRPPPAARPRPRGPRAAPHPARRPPRSRSPSTPAWCAPRPTAPEDKVAASKLDGLQTRLWTDAAVPRRATPPTSWSSPSASPTGRSSRTATWRSSRRRSTCWASTSTTPARWPTRLRATAARRSSPAARTCASSPMRRRAHGDGLAGRRDRPVRAARAAVGATTGCR